MTWTWLGYRSWRVAITGSERYETCPRTIGDRQYRVVSYMRHAVKPVRP